MPTIRATFLLLAAACAAHHPSDPLERQVEAVTGAVRASYGPAVRRVVRILPPRGTGVPTCPRDAEGFGDVGYLLVVQEREVGTEMAVVVATVVCRRGFRQRLQEEFMSITERFTLERRGTRWRIISRQVIEDGAR
jgi:hypothetical protein